MADQSQEWFLGGAADGFNITPPLLPGGPADFVDHVVPELRARGLFRHEYEGRTLRDHYGLPRPPSRCTASRLELAPVPWPGHGGRTSTCRIFLHCL